MTMLESGLTRRLGIGMSGQAFSRLVLALNTVALVPILIKAWGLDGYGQWIALTAVASYMSSSNFGLVSTSANEIIMAIGGNRIDDARQTFQMAINLTIFVVLPLIVILVIIIACLPIASALHLTTMSRSTIVSSIAIFGGIIWLQTLRGLVVAALYSTGSYGFAYYIAGGCKLLELLGIALAVIVAHSRQLPVAGVMALAAVLDLAIVSLSARRAAPWARIDIRTFDAAWILRQAKPTLGFLLSNFSIQAVLVQGPRVLLGALLGGAAVATYSIYATTVRLMDQLLLMLALPLEIEIAHSVGRRELTKTYQLITIGVQVSWVLFGLVAIFLVAFGPGIFHLWTRGAVRFDYLYIALYLLMSACNQLGRISGHALISTNRLFGPSFLSLLFSLIALAVGGTLVIPLGLIGMVVGGILGELLISLVMIFSLCRWMERPVLAFFRDMLDYGASASEFRKWVDRPVLRKRPAG